jgi:hypothetical protein
MQGVFYFSFFLLRLLNIRYNLQTITQIIRNIGRTLRYLNEIEAIDRNRKSATFCLHPFYLIYSFFLPVLMPKGKYNGQKLIRLVSTRTTASTISIMPNTPVITCVKNKIANTTATSILIDLSIAPMFFFMFVFH